MRVRAATVAVTVVLLVSSCRTHPSDCRHESSERCLWERGVAPPITTPNPDAEFSEGAVDGDGVTHEPTKLDDTLDQLISIIGAGVDWALVDETAQQLCSEPAHAPELAANLPAATEGAWTCSVAELAISGQTFDLEASDGVLSLSAVNITEQASAELFEFAQRRFDGRCANRVFESFAGDALAEFRRCSLPEGPFLVVARFPREAGRWQVSIAVVDAG